MGGAFSALAQTPATPGVVIRERVEVAPADPDASPTTALRADPCAGGTVAYLVLSGAGYNGNMPHTRGAPLTGSVAADGPCGAASGALADGFERLVFPGYDDGYSFLYNPVGEILRYPLSPAAPRPAVSATVAGETLPASLAMHYGCWPSYGGTCTRVPPDLVEAAFGILQTVEGAATGHAHAWPDTVACGTATPLPVTLTKPDGTEGYVGPALHLYYQLPGWSSPAQGALAYDGTTGGAAGVPYGDARTGEVAFVAPACAGLAAPTAATLWVTGTPDGSLLSDLIAVVPPPPARFAITANPDTLTPGQTATVVTVATSGAGTETYVPPGTPVTLTVSDPALGSLYYQRPGNSNSQSGPSVTVPYAEGQGWSVSGARRGVEFRSSAPRAGSRRTCRS